MNTDTTSPVVAIYKPGKAPPKAADRDRDHARQISRYLRRRQRAADRGYPTLPAV